MSLSVIMSSCSLSSNPLSIEDRIVMIRGTHDGQVITWLGYRYDDQGIVTSAHVVSDDRYRYEMIMHDTAYPLSLVSRDRSRDIAYMVQSGWVLWSPDVLMSESQRALLHRWDPIMTYVIRDGMMHTLTWHIIDTHGSIIWYSDHGDIITLSGVLLTDLSVLPWESGAPIFSLEWKLIDVVHVRGE